nr:pollen-specific leucine-rich repeat extensin-like protein 1 [Aegilops tauschii subsp. strangulata]
MDVSRYQRPPPPWAAGKNPWTSVVHAYHMPVPWAPTPGLLGPRPAGHQAFFGAPHQPYGAPLAPPPLGGYGAHAQAPPYGGQPPPPVPAPWDPALLAALHSAPSPSNSGGGGDWYMDSGATAHMTAHLGFSGFGSFDADPRTLFLE